METAITRAVVHVIADMCQNFREDLTIDGVTQAAGFSRFHFSREFTHLIGVSPRRFLRAVRFEEAKRLLSDSRLNIAEISHAVGYSSVGTFSSCFKSCTGVTPSTYRRMRSVNLLASTDPQGGNTAAPVPMPLRGHVQAPTADQSGVVFVGLFPSPVPNGHPVRCTVLPRPGAFVLDHVPTGNWHVLARSVTQSGGEGRRLGHTPAVGGVGPFTTPADREPDPVAIRLYPAELAALRFCSAPHRRLYPAPIG
ncbi:helix-turn-helix transcriptional regulator [Streptomyces niveiscabiei]|uniref:helix-turn-helix transcriptional regulator n=1 Tax=Streptomyces TaxID=1883 RepID=UPI0006EB3E82|nr:MULTISPECIES: AraC family transcriptional regulator [Streptomyces]